MSNLWLVARREFVARGKSSGYIITTIVMALVLLGTTLAPTFMEKKSRTEALTVNVLDNTGQVATPLQEAVKMMAGQPGAREVVMNIVTGDEETQMDVARKNSNLALLIVDGNFPGAVKARYYSASANVMNYAGAVLTPLQGIVRAARMQASGVSPTVAAEILKPMDEELKQITVSGESRSQSEFMGSMFVALGVVMVLYMVVLLNGQFVFQGVLEEKVSRVVEVMAASVGPKDMLSGKVLGLGALGLVQFLAMMGAWAAGTVVANMITETPTPMPGIDKALVALAFLVMGYLLSATLMAAAASTISRMEDQNTVVMPVTMLQALPMLFITPVLMDPNSSTAAVLSMIPFFSQSIMVMRILMTDVPTWQLGVSVGLMLLTTLGGVMAGGRIYRAALLSYGTRPSLKQIFGYLKG